MTLGYIKNKKWREKMKMLDDYINGTQVNVAHLELEHFEWLRNELNCSSAVNEFMYRHATIKKLR